MLNSYLETKIFPSNKILGFGNGIFDKYENGLVTITRAGLITLNSNKIFRIGDMVYWNDRDVEYTNKKYRYTHSKRIKNTRIGICVQSSDNYRFFTVNLLL